MTPNGWNQLSNTCFGTFWVKVVFAMHAHCMHAFCRSSTHFSAAVRALAQFSAISLLHALFIHQLSLAENFMLRHLRYYKGMFDTYLATMEIVLILLGLYMLYWWTSKEADEANSNL